ncbi:hypothetical protein Dimus_024770 [Dionaea muscipula]
MIHNRKKDVAKSKVSGVKIEFDHTKLASILGIPGNNGICEYIKEGHDEAHYVISGKDHELPYGDWMTMVFEAFGVPLVDKKGEEPKRYDYFEETFLTMCKLTRENGVWWIGMVDDAADEGESGSGEKFYDAEDKDQGSPEVNEELPAAVTQGSAQQKDKESSGVDPSCPTGRIPEAVTLKFHAEFERTRANRFQADLEKAQVENARLLALLTKPNLNSSLRFSFAQLSPEQVFLLY